MERWKLVCLAHQNVCFAVPSCLEGLELKQHEGQAYAYKSWNSYLIDLAEKEEQNVSMSAVADPAS